MVFKNKIMDAVTEDASITLPIASAEWTGEPVVIPVTRLRMSGGSEGKQWTEFVRRIPLASIKPEDFITVTDYEGEEKVLNTRYVVAADNAHSIVKGVVDKKDPFNNIYEYYWIFPNEESLHVKFLPFKKH